MPQANVLDVLRARATGERDDGHRVALCIEGGGMRGVVSGGMVCALGDLGLTDVFDAVYGASAGALAGAYLLAGQAHEGTSIYYEDLPARGFISWRRWLARGPLMDMDGLLDDVMVHQKPLDARAVLAARPELRAMAFDIEACMSVALPAPRSRDELWEALRASSRVPAFGGPAVMVSGRRHCDAMFDEAIPCRSPLADGASHLLVLATRPFGPIDPLPPWTKLLTSMLVRRWDPALAGVSVCRSRVQEGDVALLNGLAGVGRALVIGPEGPEVARDEMNPDTLRAGKRAGYDAVVAALGQLAC